jgi:type II secretion system protein C
MTKKKNGIFSKIKNKFSKKSDDDFEEDIYEEYDDEEYEEGDFEESTGEVNVDPSLLDTEEPVLSKATEGTNNNITFDSLESEEDEVEDLLNNREASTEDSSSIEEYEEEEEEFVAQEFKISDSDKIDLQELDQPPVKFDTLPEENYEEDEEYEDDQNYEDELYELPKPSVGQRFQSLLSNLKEKMSSRKEISFDDETSSHLSEHPKKKFNFSMGNLEQLTWQGFVEKTFSPDSRQAIHRSFMACLILGSSYYGGKLVATGLSTTVSPKKSTRRSSVAPYAKNNYRTQMKSIAKSNLFNTKNPQEVGDVKPVDAPRVDEELVCLTAKKKSNLGIKLINTIVLQDSVKSIASVQMRGSKKVLNIREGEKISNAAQVGKIDRLRLVVKNLKTGDCEYVENKPKGSKKSPIKVISSKKGKPLLNKYKDSRIKNVGNNFKIKKKVRDEMLSNISEVLTQAKAIQIKNPDGTLAFKMTEVVPGSIYSKLNIQDGDIISGINGKKFSNLNDIMNLFGKIKEIDNFEITLRRDGSEQTLEYNFE